MGTGLSLPPRPLGPPPLPPAVRGRLSGPGLVAGLAQAALSGLWLLTRRPEATAGPSQRPAPLVHGEEAGWESRSFPPEQGPLPGRAVFTKEVPLSIPTCFTSPLPRDPTDTSRLLLCLTQTVLQLFLPCGIFPRGVISLVAPPERSVWTPLHRL